MSKHPKYNSQPMIGSSSTAPAVSPWVYTVKVFGGRWFAIALSVADGMVTFAGIRAGGSSWFAALAGALFIAIFQASIALAIASGQPVGRRFQARFFEDSGAVGAIKRAFGILIIALGLGFYLWDMATNYAAFTDGQWLPGEPGEPLSMGGVVLVVGYILLSIAFSLGDEILHVIADENAIGQQANAVRYQGQRYEAQLLNEYQRHYMRSAKPVADNLGAEHGANWRPRDLQ
jgi:hypothetical protein